jgi:hypothetical protein
MPQLYPGIPEPLPASRHEGGAKCLSFPPRRMTGCRDDYGIDDEASVMPTVHRLCRTEENAADLPFAPRNYHTSSVLAGILQAVSKTDACGAPNRVKVAQS